MGNETAWKCHSNRDKHHFTVEHDLSDRNKLKGLAYTEATQFYLILLSSQKFCEITTGLSSIYKNCKQVVNLV